MSNPLACPGCRGPMQKRSFARQAYLGGDVELDLCWECQAIWLDKNESAQLSPGAVIALFRLIHENRRRPGRPLADSMSCPHCQRRLSLTRDIQRTNRLTYHRCPLGHGRFTTFLQFLMEKQFVRSLSQAEVDRLKVTISQVRCSSCGGPVALARDAVCPFCHSPVAILDPEAVGRTLAALTEAERHGTRPDAEKLADVFNSLHSTRRERGSGFGRTMNAASIDSSATVVDLVAAGLGRIFER